MIALPFLSTPAALTITYQVLIDPIREGHTFAGDFRSYGNGKQRLRGRKLSVQTLLTGGINGKITYKYVFTTSIMGDEILRQIGPHIVSAISADELHIPEYQEGGTDLARGRNVPHEPILNCKNKNKCIAHYIFRSYVAIAIYQ